MLEVEGLEFEGRLLRPCSFANDFCQFEVFRVDPDMSQLLQAHLDCGDRDQLGWSQVVKAASGDTIWKLGPGEPAWDDR